MKRLFLSASIFFFYQFSLAIAYNQQDTKSQQIIKHKIESIELIEGTPKKNFIKIQPVLASASTMEAAVKKVKKQAAKVNADAIIEISFGTQHRQDTAFVGGVYIDASGEESIIKGWAIKWQNSK